MNAINIIGVMYVWSICAGRCRGVYYWQNGSRNDKAQVRLETSDDDKTTELHITGVSASKFSHSILLSQWELYTFRLMSEKRFIIFSKKGGTLSSAASVAK